MKHINRLFRTHRTKHKLFPLVTFAPACLVGGLLSGLGQGCQEPGDADEPRAVEASGSALSADDREAEVAEHLERTYYSRFKVQQTTRGPFGEVVDWVDPHELDPLFDQRRPPPDSAEEPAEPPSDAETAEPPVNQTSKDTIDLKALWEEPDVRGPTGTVPVIRPNFDSYVSGRSGATNLEEFLNSLAKSSPQPSGQQRLYANKIHSVTNEGTQGWINYVNPASVSSSGGTFSLGQLAVVCEGTNRLTTMEAVEVGIQEFPNLYGDNNIHFFTYFRTAGVATGNYIGGYNMDQAGFVQTGSFPPGAVIPNPPAGSSHERRIRARISDGAWWVQDHVGGTSQWIGYYPIGSGSSQIPFNLINTSACRVDWYGEVFDPTETDWTAANMGNGVFGRDSGSLFFRGMYTEQAGPDIWFNGTNGGPLDTNCYDTSNLFTSSTSGWQVWFRWGGPGGDNSGCN